MAEEQYTISQLDLEKMVDEKFSEMTEGLTSQLFSSSQVIESQLANIEVQLDYLKEFI